MNFQVIPGGRLPLLSTRPAVTVPAEEIVLQLVPSHAAWWQRHISVNNLPKVVTQLCPVGTKPTVYCSQVQCLTATYSYQLKISLSICCLTASHMVCNWVISFCRDEGKTAAETQCHKVNVPIKWGQIVCLGVSNQKRWVPDTLYTRPCCLWPVNTINHTWQWPSLYLICIDQITKPETTFCRN